ncbi:MAG: head-tail adaptor protein [Pseudoruegeria sp.]
MAGRDVKIQVQNLAMGAADELNEAAEVWAYLVDLWARRVDLSDSEKTDMGEQVSSRVARFVVRSNSQSRLITSEDRLICATEPWRILGAKESAKGRSRSVEILAAIRSDGA